MALVNLRGRRVPVSAIKEYTDPGEATSRLNDKPYIKIKIYQTTEYMYFESFKEKENLLAYLDKVLGVKEII